MVTLAIRERFAFAQASIEAYCRQTYPAKELVVVVDAEDPVAARALIGHLDSLGRDDIRVTIVSNKTSLGALRNISLQNAAGEYVCQWDDDDLHHPGRIDGQLAALVEKGCEAVFMQDVLQYFPASRALYWTNWQSTESGGHPGSLFYRRSAAIRYPETGGEASLGEDTAVARALRARGGVGLIAGQPHLFLYVSHGQNTWAMNHHRMLADELSISHGLLRRREQAIRDSLAAFSLGEAAVEVRSRDGVAFVVHPAPGRAPQNG